MSGVSVRAVGLVTGWGRGVEALPAVPAIAADGRAVIAARPAPRAGERLRRATRECHLAVEAVEALLEDGALTREQIAGAGTALVYVTAAAYGASNRAFIDGGGGALHFPYTAPSAVPAEVAIEFGLHGPYAVLIGGAATTVDAIDHAATLLARGACDRAVVLAVETFVECADILARGGMMGNGAPVQHAAAAEAAVAAPLVEAAVAALFVRDEQSTTGEESGGLGGRERRVGQAATGGHEAAKRPRSPSSEPRTHPTLVSAEPSAGFACGPLIALARVRGERSVAVSGEWRGRRATTTVGVARQGPARPGWKER